MKENQVRNIVAVSLFAALFALYAYTAAPEVTLHDSGELITGAVSLGIPHPPGSPTWCLVGHLFTKLPIGSYAYRIHLMSGFFAALTCALVYVLVLNLARRNANGTNKWHHHVSGILAALLLAQAPSFWEKAVQAELYTMNAFFMMAIFCVLERWVAGDSKGSSQDKKLLLIALLFGVGLGNYQALSFIAPVVVITVAMCKPLIFKEFRLLAGLVLAGLAGMMVYLYLPIRSVANPPLDWGNPETWNNFKLVMFRSHWGRLTYTAYSGEFMRRWLKSIELLSEFGLPALVLALAGVAEGFRRRLTISVVMVLCLIVGEVWMMMMQALTPSLNSSLYYVTSYGLGEFHIPTYVILAVFAGIGANAIADYLGSSRVFLPTLLWERRVLGVLAAAVCAALYFVPHFERGDFRRYVQPHAYGLKVLEQLEPNSWLLSSGDDPQFVLCYLKFCENVRQDMALIKPLNSYMGKLQELADCREGCLTSRDFIEMLARDAGEGFECRYNQHVPADPARTPVYFARLEEPPNLLKSVYPTGLVFKVDDVGNYSKEAQLSFWKKFFANPLFVLRPNSKHDFREMMAIILEHHGHWHFDHKEYDMAKLMYGKSLEYAEDQRSYVLDNLAYSLFELGELNSAFAMCKKAITADFRDKQAWTTLGRVCVARKRFQDAIKCFESILEFSPQDEDALYNIKLLRSAAPK